MMTIDILKKCDADALLYKKSSGYSHLMWDNNENLLRIISGLDASAGIVVLSSKGNALFVDGRYAIAAKKYVCTDKFDIFDLNFSRSIEWLKEKVPPESSIAYDPRFYTHMELEKIQHEFRHYALKSIDLRDMLKIKPSRRNLNIFYLHEKPQEWKLNYVREVMAKNNLAAYLLCDPASACWLLDVRDLDTKYTMTILGYLLITKDEEYIYYLDEIYDFEESATLKSQRRLSEDLKKYKTVGIDKWETPASIRHGNFLHLKNPCILPKSVKTEAEISDIRCATMKDSAAIINFLHWMYENHANGVTEQQASQKVLYFREQQSNFIGESFPCIAAADKNAAMVHYLPTESCSIIKDILLLDSGGQYMFGTTDITRTVCFSEPTEEHKMLYTLVLKGHIAVATAKLPVGALGSWLEPLSRQYLWNNFLDYNHSTGHGIGYLLNVHEGPLSISKNCYLPLKSGMLLSNEPGYYKENDVGIRLENMMFVQEASSSFLEFETISLVPFDAKFVNKLLLSLDEIDWLRRYHSEIISKMITRLPENVVQWLMDYCDSWLR
ncbi:MAG: M24 family metallopeptidase [Holosporaceae bacterium]|jgi:Xaa-Pro aminopeptidase|nr:M24 family metallopeptidase [Holosporaceae bacterium]